MGFKSTVSNLLVNRTFLNVVFIVSLLNVIGYIVYGNIHAVIFFILIAGIVGHFSKNMTVVLLIPLFLSNFFVLSQNRREGMETTTTMTKEDVKEKVQSADPAKVKDTINKINQKASTKQGLPITPIHDDVPLATSTAEESFEVGRGKKGGYDIDYAATIEDAYDELNKVIGGDGIQKLTADTQQLMNQQLQLTKAMQGFAPMLENMKPLMESVGPMLEQAKGMMGSSGANMAEMAKKYTPSKKKE
jgi:hypothetical protein